MAITVKARPEGRTINAKGRTRSFSDQYLISGCPDDPSAAMQALADATQEAISIAGILCYPTNRKVDEKNGDLWYASVDYSSNEIKVVGGTGMSYSFDIGFESEHRKYSEGDISVKIAEDDFDRTFGNAIGVEENNGTWIIRGEDIEIPYQNMTISKEYSAGSLKDSDISGWTDITNTVNNGTFRGHPAGCVRFNGARGSLSNGVYRFDFSFSIKKNRTVTIGTIPPFTLKGWQRYWVFERPKLDPDSGLIVTMPVNATIYNRYLESNFGVLGLSGSIVPYQGIVPGVIN